MHYLKAVFVEKTLHYTSENKSMKYLVTKQVSFSQPQVPVDYQNLHPVVNMILSVFVSNLNVRHHMMPFIRLLGNPPVNRRFRVRREPKQKKPQASSENKLRKACDVLLLHDPIVSKTNIKKQLLQKAMQVFRIGQEEYLKILLRELFANLAFESFNKFI